MKYDLVKNTTEEMAVKIFEYINASGLSQSEQDNLCQELGTSFLTASVHETDPAKATRMIMATALAMGKVGVDGYLNFLNGDASKVKCDLSE